MHENSTKTCAGRCLEALIRVDIVLIVASTTVLAAGFIHMLAGTDGIPPAGAALQFEPETKFVLAAAGQADEGAAEPSAAGPPCDSFNERFASAFGSAGHAAGKVAAVEEHDNVRPLVFAARATEPVITTPAVARPVVPQGPMTPVPPRRPSAGEERLKVAQASVGLSLPLDAGGRTAIYDIAARTVYLPNGTRLEAHSGLGSLLDNPRYVRTKMQGPTPPNVYKLTLREALFHGVRAIRLVPVNDEKMFGRDGILAHSYMLGPSGQSNGCVSFRDYPAFLNAFLKGEVDRLVVVDHLVATTAGTKTVSASGS
jgi:hypothetical protein